MAQDETPNVETQGTADAAPTRKPRNPRAPRKNGGGESRHSVRRIESVEKAAQALDYRKMGASYAQIAEKLEFASPQAAWDAVERALKRTLQESADEVRKLELTRLDSMFLGVYPNAVRGDLMAINSCITIMNRRAKLLGIDAPVKTQNTTDFTAKQGVLVVNPVMSPEEWAAAAKAQQEQLIRDAANLGSEDGDAVGD